MVRTFSNRLRSFKHAFRGIYEFFRSEPNARIHLAAATTVVALAVWARCSPTEWAVLALAIALVIGLEMVNTAVEKIMNHLHPQHHAAVKTVKDIAAGAVLVAAIAAVVVALLIFIPKLR